MRGCGFFFQAEGGIRDRLVTGVQTCALPILKMCRQGLNLEGQRVVCIFTGNGLKDPDLAVRSVVSQTTEIEPTLEAVEAASLATAS